MFSSPALRRAPFRRPSICTPPASEISRSPPCRPCVTSTWPWTSPPAVTGVNTARPSTTRKTPDLPSTVVSAAFGIDDARPRLLALRRLGREGDARREVRQHAVVGVEERDLHAHGRLLAVGGRHDLAQPAVVDLVGHRVERDLGRLVLRELGEVRLVHVGADVERRELDDRRDRAARAAARGRRAEGRHGLADERALGRDHARERRADDRVVEQRLDVAHPGARRGLAGDGRVERGLRA